MYKELQRVFFVTEFVFSICAIFFSAFCYFFPLKGRHTSRFICCVDDVLYIFFFSHDIWYLYIYIYFFFICKKKITKCQEKKPPVLSAGMLFIQNAWIHYHNLHVYLEEIKTSFYCHSSASLSLSLSPINPIHIASTF